MRSPLLSATLLVATLLMPALSISATAQTTSPATASKMAMPAPTTPATPHPAAAKATADTTSIVNINTATGPQLDALPQIGAKRTAKIIAGRPYKSVDELVTKKVLSPKLFDKLKPRLTV